MILRMMIQLQIQMENTYSRNSIVVQMDDDEWQDYVESEITPNNTQEPNHNKPLSKMRKQPEITKQQIPPQKPYYDEYSFHTSVKSDDIIEIRDKVLNHAHDRLIMELVKHKLDVSALEGQIFLNISEPSLHSENRNDKGKLLITNYRFAFFVEQKKKLDIPLGYIERISLKDKTDKKGGLILEIILKHSPVWKFKYDKKEEGNMVDVMLNNYVFPSKTEYIFAFSFARDQHIIKKKKIYYNFESEYSRIGIIQNKRFRRFESRICSTYPTYIFTPNQCTDLTLRSVAKARERERIPVATYLMNNQFCLWRGSHLRESSNKSQSDSEYLNAMSEGGKLIVFDVKSKSQNKLHQEHYKEHELVYVELQPLSKLKQAYFSMVAACLTAESKKYIKSLVESGWYMDIRNILSYSNRIANALSNNDVFVNCQDGWDRTSQLCALALLMLDPHYRTLEGFPVLIEKQFSSFGQPWGLRIGSKAGSQAQIPVFIQFLDCVSQLLNQFPLSFQFNHKYLSLLSNLTYTNKYGNFLTSCQEEYLKQKIFEKTLSVWDELRQNPLCINPYFLDQTKNPVRVLEPALSIRNMRFWKENFYYLTTQLRDTYKLHPHAEQNSDYIYLQHSKLKTETEMVRKQVDQQAVLIQKLQFQIEEELKKKQKH